MAKTILIPIDFSVESLNTLKLALQQQNEEKVDVVLIYAEHLTTSIRELLYYSPSKRIQALTSSKFTDAISILRNSYESSIQSISIKLYHGFNSTAFANFAEGNKIDIIYIPASYRLKPVKNGFDPIPQIKKSKILFREVEWNTDNKASDENALTQLFK